MNTTQTPSKSHRIAPAFNPDDPERARPTCDKCGERIGVNYATRNSGRGSGWTHLR